MKMILTNETGCVWPYTDELSMRCAESKLVDNRRQEVGKTKEPRAVHECRNQIEDDVR